MFLSQSEIASRQKNLFPVDGQFQPDNLKEASYDLRVGDEVFLSEQRIPVRLDREQPWVTLPPGQFALIKTFEKIRIPRDLLALISIRSKFKFQGLTNISGFHVDPTYEGNLIFSVQNVGPNDIRLKYMEPVFMIMWARLSKPYEGAWRKKTYNRIELDQMAQLGGSSVTLTSLKKELDQMGVYMKIYGALAVGLFVAVIAVILRYLPQLAGK